MTDLVHACDADFLWMLGGEASRPGLRLPPGGVDTPETLLQVRAIDAAARLGGGPGTWMMVARGEVVGLCGAVRLAGDDGVLEIGYGVAQARRRLGHATGAVAAVVALTRSDETLRAVTAVTAAGNLSSQAVLVRNGFAQTGREVRDDDGAVILWRLDLRGADCS